MNPEDFRSVIDFGLVILIWLVQIIIYPALQYYKQTDLLVWHRVYTRRISIFVMPLMITQMAILIYTAFSNGDWSDLLSLVLAVLCWLITFRISWPLHRRIMIEDSAAESVARLIRTNWSRTLLFTLIFILGVF